MHRTELSFRELSTSGLCARGGDVHVAQDAAWRAREENYTEELRSGEQWRAPDWRRFVR
jgi:hypothetical protein